MQQTSDEFAHTIVELYGTTGSDWLKRLPILLAECAARWSLYILPPFEHLTYNYVAPAVRADGTDVVLKAGVPNPELFTEIAALRIFGGHGIVQLLDADLERGALLLERLKPGATLLTVADDEQAISIAARVMRELWKPAPPEHPFPTIATWARGFERLRKQFDGGTGPFPKHLVERAESIYREFTASMTGPMLLHGDLHHENILSAERQPWLALDPKGVIGEPEYEVGALLRNRIPSLLDDPHVGRILARRVDQLAEELGFARARIIGWGMAQAVLSAWWSFEDHGHSWEPAIQCARLLVELK